MAKKIILIVGTFLILMGGLVVYQQLNGASWFTASPQSRPSDKKHEPISGRVAGPGDVQMGFSQGKDPVLYQVAKDGRREGRYSAQKWEIVGKETRLTKPQVELYPKGGQVIYITADEGTIIANQASDDGTIIAGQGGSSSGSVRRGSLRGNVCVSIDTAADTNDLKAPREQRPDDFIDVYTEQVSFDNDLLEITASGKVKVYSREADIFGQGLTIRWNTGPREISRLLLAKGERLDIYKEIDELGLDMPGAEATAQPTADLTPRPTASSASATASAPTTTPATGKADEPQYYQITMQDNVQVEAVTRIADKAAKIPDAVQGKAHVEDCTRWLHDADKLTIKVEITDFKQQMTSRAEDGAPAKSSAKSSATSSATSSASQPASAPARHGGKAPTAVVTWSGPLEMTPILGKAPNLELGGFDFEAQGKALKLGETRVVQRGGQKVKEESVATCQWLTFRSLDRSGEMWNEDGTPVHLASGTGEEISCPRIAFSRDLGTARFTGPGWMKMRVSDSGVNPAMAFESMVKSSSAARVASAAESAAQKAKRSTTISWADSVDTTFGTLLAVKDGEPAKDYLKKAVFSGKTHIVQVYDNTVQPVGTEMFADRLTVNFAKPDELAKSAGDSPYSVSSKIDTVLAEGHVEQRQVKSADQTNPTDFFKADRVELAMAPEIDELAPAMPVAADSTPAPETGPATMPSIMGESTVIATGNVEVQRQNSRITAQYVKVYFRKATKEEVADGADSIVPLRMKAFGDVVASDTRPDKQAEIRGRWLESDLVKNTATIVGDLAKTTATTDDDQAMVTQKDTWIKSGKLVVDMSPVSSGSDITKQQVDGIDAGSMGFVYTPKGPDGKDSGEARPVTIEWTKKLLYRGLEDRAEFEGAVALDSQTDHIKSQKLKILFDPLPTTQPAEPATTLATTRKSPMDGSFELAKRSIKRVEATTQVSVRREESDPKTGNLLSYMGITSETLTFTALGGEMLVNGPGRMLLLDYQPEKPKDPAEVAKTGNAPTLDPLGPDALTQPNQTVIDWRKQMIFTQDTRTVTFNDAYMVHRSGDNVLPMGFKTGDWPKAGKGRLTTLSCVRLECRFGDVDSSASSTTKPASDGMLGNDLLSGARMGSLEFFDASGGIVLTDGAGLAQGERLTYSWAADMATISGDKVGETGHLATLTLNDPKPGQSKVFSAAEITWYKHNNRVETHNVQGGGGGK